jgi:hypothetical protein
MSNNPIKSIFESAISSAFNHHQELSPPALTPIQVEIVDLEKFFLNNLNTDQREEYETLSARMAEHDSRNLEYYYRLGFIDGLNAWRDA